MKGADLLDEVEMLLLHSVHRAHRRLADQLHADMSASVKALSIFLYPPVYGIYDDAHLQQTEARAPSTVRILPTLTEATVLNVNSNEAPGSTVCRF